MHAHVPPDELTGGRTAHVVVLYNNYNLVFVNFGPMGKEVVISEHCPKGTLFNAHGAVSCCNLLLC